MTYGIIIVGSGAQECSCAFAVFCFFFFLLTKIQFPVQILPSIPTSNKHSTPHLSLIQRVSLGEIVYSMALGILYADYFQP